MTIKEARRTTGFAEAQFKKLPAEHSDVKAAADALKEAVARIDAAEKALVPIARRLTKLVDPSSYPELETDMARLKELVSMVTVGSFQHDRPGLAELSKQLPAMKAESARLEQKYTPLLKQNSGESTNLKNLGQKLSYATERFEEGLAKEKQTLPQEIDNDLADVARLTAEAVKEAKPAFFSGGIAGTLRLAEDKLVLYAALDPAGGKLAAEKLAKAREDVKQAQQSLAGAIIEANSLPQDAYTGPDKPDVVKRATDALKKQRRNAQVPAVRIPSQKWERETMWRHQNREWYRIDRSRLQAQVIVKRDDKIAEIHPINLWIDHMKGDAVTAFSLFGEKEELAPDTLLSLAKVK